MFPCSVVIVVNIGVIFIFVFNLSNTPITLNDRPVYRRTGSDDAVVKVGADPGMSVARAWICAISRIKTTPMHCSMQKHILSVKKSTCFGTSRQLSAGFQ
jgi:hypothetical protein